MVKVVKDRYHVINPIYLGSQADGFRIPEVSVSTFKCWPGDSQADARLHRTIS